jgi:hypothetical protein
VKSKRPQQKTRREKKRLKRKTIFLIFSIVGILGSFFYIMNHDFMAINNIEIKGQKTLIEEDITKLIHNYMNESVIGILPKDNLLILNTDTIERKIRDNFPTINNISVKKKNGDTLEIHLGERTAHSLWCVDREYLSIFDQECYFADNQGLLYARAPYFSGNIYLKTFIPNREDEMYIGTAINEVNSFLDYFDFIDSLQDDYLITIGNIYITEFDDVSIEIYRLQKQKYTERKPVILYNQKTDYLTIHRDIGIVLDFKSFKSEFSNSPQLLESIDVRFENRALYTFNPIDSDSE